MRFDIFPLRLCVFALIVCTIFTSCRKPPPTDMRLLVPSESLVYLETRDLGEMLDSLTQNKSFQQIVKTKTDFSALENTQTAVVVTGFETSEKQLTDEAAILNFKPQFAVIADTHAWEFTNLSLVENQIGRFAARIYGEDVKLEKFDKSGAKVFVWTANDNRKLFAAVSGSVVYIGNNENLLDKCLAVKRGENENLLKNENLSQAHERGGDEKIAFGYVSPEGVSRLADLAGVSVAIDAAEEVSARSFIARILPVIVKKTVREISWTARKTEQGIEDKIYIKTDAEISSVWKETLVSNSRNPGSAEFLPSDFDSVTRYNLQNPQIAWRSVLFALSSRLDAPGANILAAVSGSLFASYGIADIEMFLSAVGSEIITARFDAEGVKSVAIVEVKDEAKLKSAIIKEINFSVQPEKLGAANIWNSSDGELTAAFIEGKLILGDGVSVLNCLKAMESGQTLAKTAQFQKNAESNAAAVTIAKDTETAGKIARILGNVNGEKKFTSFYTVETRFNSNGIERKTVSDFGLIGTLVGQFGEGS